MFSRLELLIGDKINKLHNAKIIVFGIGGVGGYTVEMLARSGVGHLTLVDYDMVDITNKNRQIIALNSTIGRNKVDVMKERILDYYPECQVNTINQKLTPDNISEFNLEDYDYIVDAIDMVSSKIALIVYAKEHNCNIISAMGAGNRIGMPQFKVTDIFKTYNDKLAKVLRKELRDRGIASHQVLLCENNPISCGKTIGSIATFPAVAGCMLASFVIEEIIKE